MEPKEPISERQRRLQHHNEMKPVYKSILGATFRGAFKLMKLLLKTAFQIPGMVKRMAASSPAENINGPARRPKAYRSTTRRS